MTSHSPGIRRRTALAALFASAAALGGCGGGDAEPQAPQASDPPDEHQANTKSGSTLPEGWLWGVTTDDPRTGTTAQIDALKSFGVRPTVRMVFDAGEAASGYDSEVGAFARVANVMGQPVDSVYMSDLSVDQVSGRIDEYLRQFGDVVQLWEVGNEVNGDWLGDDVVQKIERMYDPVKRAGGQTVLTTYYEPEAAGEHDMLDWIDRNLPAGHRMRSGLDYVMVSYYEDENGGHQLTQAEIDAMFTGLHARFPNARLAIGEYGWGKRIPTDPQLRASLIRRVQGYRVPSVPAFVGGGFYWHFNRTMSPKSKPDWAVLNGLMAQATRPSA